MTTYSFNELCEILGKDPLYIQNIQKHMGLPANGRKASYSENYLLLLEKVIALRTFSVPLDTISELFETEKKILSLLHFDSISLNEIWYLDFCDNDELSETCLRLTGYDLGFSINKGHIQHNLDFGIKDKELFKGSEMGEDVRKVLAKYNKIYADIRQRVEKEEAILKNALSWAARLFAEK